MLQQYRSTNWPQILSLTVLIFILIILWLFNASFVTPLLLGLIMATLTFGVFSFFEKRLFRFQPLSALSSTLSGIFTLLLVSIILFAGLDFLGMQVSREAPNFVAGIANFSKSIPSNKPLLANLNKIGVNEPTAIDLARKFNTELEKYLIQSGDKRKINIALQPADFGKLSSFSGGLFKIVFDYLVYFVIFLLAWFNALVSGKSWLRTVFSLLPFDQNEQRDIVQDLKSGVSNVVYANLLGGLIHTTICFVVMLIFGVPNIFILSVIIFLIGVLPLSPSELAYALPFLIILPTNPAAAIAFGIFGELVILFVNYVLMPKIINSGQEGNPLLIITSIISGISIFGIMGFVIGPMIMIFVQTLFSILVQRNTVKV